MSDHESSVLQQFGPQAQAYLTSAVHARGPDLERTGQLLRDHVSPPAHALDVGCGAGHLSFTLASHCEQVTALDPSAEMRDVVRVEAARRGFTGLRTVEASAGRLPFPDASFDVVATRYSAHHWVDVAAAVAQMRRVLRPDGYALVIDTLGDASALVDTHLQAIEVLRDRSHVRNLTDAQWRRVLADHGLVLLDRGQWPTRLQFDSWVGRMRTSAARIAAIRTLQIEAPQEVRDALHIEVDGSFTIQTGLYWIRTTGD